MEVAPFYFWANKTAYRDFNAIHRVCGITVQSNTERARNIHRIEQVTKTYVEIP